MKILIICIIMLGSIFIGCSNPNKTANNSSAENVQEDISCDPFFDFDELEHYSTQIKEEEISDIESKEVISEQEQEFLDILYKYEPKDLDQATYTVSKLEELNFTKKTVDRDRYEEINKIFCENPNYSTDVAGCLAIFRDILVFKKDKKVVGVAKICFSCLHDFIIGSKYNTKKLSLGMNADFRGLGKILYGQVQ